MSPLALATDRGMPLRQNSAASAIALTDALKLPGVVMTYGRDEEVFAEEERAANVYKVISGTVRILRILDDGRRCIVSFHFAGEVFGLEIGDTHRFTAEAVTACKIASVKRTLVSDQAERSGAAARDVWRLMANEMQRTQEHSLLLSRMSAVERVSTFLKEMAERGASRGVVDLPMSRTDIADYLGLTIETVSRTMTLLQRQGVIGIEGSRHIVLCR